MLEKLSQMITDEKRRSVGLLGGAMAGIMTGAKVTPAAMFLTGMYGLEREWRKAHPEFRGGMKERWELAIAFYDATHQDPVNRALHTIGIPMILGGAIGMLASPRWTPPWWIANGSWTAGWALNFIGHGMFEKGAPAFAEDPLSFLAGPAWDFVRIKDRLVGAVRGPERPTDAAPPRTEPSAAA